MNDIVNHIANDIHALHSIDMIYNDMKISNILIYSQEVILIAKLCDFSYSISIPARKSCNIDLAKDFALFEKYPYSIPEHIIAWRIIHFERPVECKLIGYLSYLMLIVD